MRILVLMAFVFSNFLLSCQAEIDPAIINVTENELSCKLTNVQVYDEFGVADDSAHVYYSGNNITGYKYGSGDSLAIFYNANGNINKRYLYSSTGDSFDTIYYNSDGTIIKAEMYDEAIMAGQAWLRNEFHYQSGKPVRVVELINDGSGNFYQYHELLFEYTGENITKRISRYYLMGTIAIVDSIGMQYDNQPNHLKKLWKQPILATPFTDLGSFAGLANSSANNLVVEFDHTDPSSAINYTYDLNSDGYLEGTKVNGQPANKLSFQCQ